MAKAQSELEDIARRGAVMAGNAFLSVLLLKGAPSHEERGGAKLLSGADGEALRAALQALGYAPEDWAGLAIWDGQGNLLDAELLREAVCALDPSTLVMCDKEAANAVREAYADDLSLLESFEEAMLLDGLVVQLAGMRVLSLGGFADALQDAQSKQLMWRWLKQLPPLGEPY